VQRLVQPDPLVFPQVGQGVVAASDPPQGLPRAGQGGPADLVTVGQPDRAPDAGGTPQRLGEQSERGGRAEPDGIAAVRPGDLRRPLGDRRGR
jgi:hypothetical protein